MYGCGDGGGDDCVDTGCVLFRAVSRVFLGRTGGISGKEDDGGTSEARGRIETNLFRGVIFFTGPLG